MGAIRLPSALPWRALLLAALLVAASAVATAADAAAKSRGGDRIADRYVVVYRGSVDSPGRETEKLERTKGFKSRFRYGRALKGFAAKLSPRQVEQLKADPDVAFVSPDRRVTALGSVPLASGEPTPPTGIRRIEATTASTTREASTANVAVIDTGIDLAHPDLNATSGTNCVTAGTPAQDDNGHGTHVAGTIAAKNDGAGVVGVAPGTKLYAAKVLDAAGSGTTSQVLCGIDWVTSTRTDSDPANDIAVTNMSLGGGGQPVASCATTTDPEHKAICNSTAAGVTYVVAAGNDGWDFDYAKIPDTPAAYPEVLTVTAASDSDGLSGGTGGSPACATSEGDDRYASFSNFAATAAGQAHTIAAPGVCIKSTWTNGGYATSSGTSMATPHVAGAVALCLGEGGAKGPCAGLSPADIVQRMRSEAESHTAASGAYGFAGDPTRPVSGRYFGYLAWTASPAPADTSAPTVGSVSPSDGATGTATSATVAVNFSEPMDTAATQAAFSLVKSSDGSAVPGTFSWSGQTMTFRPSTPLEAGVQYTAKVRGGASPDPARDAAGNALAADKAWSFTTIRRLTAFPSATTIVTGSLRSGTSARLAADDNSYFDVNSTTTSTRTTAWYGRFAGVSNSLRTLQLTYKGRNSQSCTQTLALWNWANSSWVQLDSRSVATTEVQIDKAVGGTLANYVSGTSGDGELRLRVRCTRTSSSFYSSGDLMRIVYERP